MRRRGLRRWQWLVGVAVAHGALAQPPCDPLPPATGPMIVVAPSQAASLRGIVAGAASGTTVLLEDGVWPMDLGDSASRLVFATPGVTLRSASGNRDAVVLDGNYDTDELISIYASNVTIADLTLRRAWEHPIHISGTSNAITGVRLQNLRIVDPGEQAIKINPGSATGFADSGVIECSHIELTDVGRGFVRNSCYTGGIDGHQAWGWQVRRNRIEGFWCATGLSEHAIHFWTGSRDTVVEENVIVDCARGIGLGLGSSGAGRTYPDNPYPGVGYLGHIDGIVRNNFVAAARPELFASQYGFDAGIALEQAHGAIVAHNTVASTVAPFSSIEWRFANTAVELSNNLVTHNLRERDGNPQEILVGNITGASTGWFAEITDGDLHLTGPTLPPIGAGAPLAAGVADRDIDHQPRRSPPDVGADELRQTVFEDGFESGDLTPWRSGSTAAAKRRVLHASCCADPRSQIPSSSTACGSASEVVGGESSRIGGMSGSITVPGLPNPSRRTTQATGAGGCSATEVRWTRTGGRPSPAGREGETQQPPRSLVNALQHPASLFSEPKRSSSESGSSSGFGCGDGVG